MRRETAIRVRAAKLEDARAIAGLSRQLGYPTSAPTIALRLRSVARSREHGAFVAAGPKGEILGWIHVFVHRVLESEFSAEVGGLVVDEDFRGTGAGTALLERAERWAISKRLRSITLRSNVIRKPAHAFYLKRGYRITKTQFAFRKTL